MTPPRYTSFPLPNRRYIPGKGIHPGKHPDGSHVPEIPGQPEDFKAENWPESPHYLYAVDLFNHEFYWEAHELLEDLWNQIGKKSKTGLFFQGIIQIAAGLLHHEQQHSTGAQHLFEKGIAKVAMQENEFLGVNTKIFIKHLHAFLDNKKAQPPLLLLKIP